MKRFCRWAVVASAFVLATPAYAQPQRSDLSDAAKPIVTKVFEDYRLSLDFGGGGVFGHQLIAPLFQSDGNHVAFATIDFQAGRAKNLSGALPSDGARQFLCADARYLVTSDTKHIDLFDRKTLALLHRWDTTRYNVKISATLSADKLLVVAAEAVGFFEPSSEKVAIESIDLASFNRVLTWEGAQPGQLVLWGDKLVALDEQRVTGPDRDSRYDNDFTTAVSIFDIRHALLAETTFDLPGSEKGVPDEVHSHVVLGSRLIFSIDRRSLGIFDLAKLKMETAIAPFDQSLFYAFDVVDDLLFALPDGEHAGDAAVFEIGTGQMVTRLPLRGDYFAVDGDHIALVGAKSDPNSHLALLKTLLGYRIDWDRIAALRQGHAPPANP